MAFTKISLTMAAIFWILHVMVLFERATQSTCFTLFSPHIINASSLAEGKISSSPVEWSSHLGDMKTWYQASNTFLLTDANIANFCYFTSFSLHLMAVARYVFALDMSFGYLPLLLSHLHFLTVNFVTICLSIYHFLFQMSSSKTDPFLEFTTIPFYKVTTRNH
jgi:hypothetical protein